VFLFLREDMGTRKLFTVRHSSSVTLGGERERERESERQRESTPKRELPSYIERLLLVP
jgi:hypothetical protein